MKELIKCIEELNSSNLKNAKKLLKISEINLKNAKSLLTINKESEK